MAVTCIIANGTAAELTNVNAGGDDVAAYTLSAGISLSAAELETLLGNEGVAVMKASSDAAEKHIGTKVLKLGRNPGA